MTVPEVLPELPVTPVPPAPVLPEVTVFPVPPVFPTDEAFPALPEAAEFPTTESLPETAKFPAPEAFTLFPEAAAPSFLLAAVLSPVMIGSPVLSASLSLPPEILFSAFRSSGISSQPSAVSVEASSDELPSPGIVSDQISSSWMISGVLLRCQRAATKITTRTTAARSNTGKAGMILPLCRFPKPTFRKPERPSRKPSSRGLPFRKPGRLSRKPPSRVLGPRPFFRPSVTVFLLFRSFIYRASPRNRIAVICDQLRFTSLRRSQLRRDQHHFAAICDQARSASLRSASQIHSRFALCFATPLRFTETNSAAICNQLRFSSLHRDQLHSAPPQPTPPRQTSLHFTS